MTGWTYAEKLRALADYLDDRPALLAELSYEFEYPSARFYFYDSADAKTHEGQARFAQAVKAMGHAEKSGYSGTIYANYREKARNYDGIIFAVEASLTGACKKVEKKDSSGKVITRTIPAQPERIEPEYEYHCPESFLALGE